MSMRSIVMCHINPFKKVLIRYTICHPRVVIKSRPYNIRRLKNWAMRGLQSGKMFTALFLHSALSKYN